jgi:tocopherol O-methyltransferase
MVSSEEKVIWFYQRTKMEEWWKANETHAYHFGYYEKGYRTHFKAILHMNDVAWALLGLDGTRLQRVLDAGCGVGGTSTYLAKKYPSVIFTGISLVPSEIQVANELAHQRRVTENTRFFVDNYCATAFSDASFDGIIALESLNYARNTQTVIKEFSRVLRPGGRLVILDGFRSRNQFSPVMQKVYCHWLAGRAIDDLMYINDCVKALAEEQFREITPVDISSHTALSQVRGVVIGLPFFFSTVLKALSSLNRYKRSDDSYYMGASFCGGLLAVSGCTKYYAVTATK